MGKTAEQKLNEFMKQYPMKRIEELQKQVERLEVKEVENYPKLQCIPDLYSKIEYLGIEVKEIKDTLNGFKNVLAEMRNNTVD